MSSAADRPLFTQFPHDSLQSTDDIDATMVAFDDLEFEMPRDHEILGMDLFAQENFGFDLPNASPSSPECLQDNGPSAFDIPMLPNGTMESTSSRNVGSNNTNTQFSDSTCISASRLTSKALTLDTSLQPSTGPDAESDPRTSMSMATAESPSPTRSPSPSLSSPSSPTSPLYDDGMMPVVACANCKRSHIKCDHGRPCQNCLKHPSKISTCRDAVPKPRGRPKGGSKAAVSDVIIAARCRQHQGFQPFSGSTILGPYGQPEQPSPHCRPRAMSFPHASPAQQASAAAMMQQHHNIQQQHDMLLHRQEHQRLRPHYHHRTVSHSQVPTAAVEFYQTGYPLSSAPWGNGAPGVPEMMLDMSGTPTHHVVPETTLRASAGPQCISPIGFNSLALDAYELEQLQKHRQQHQQHQQMQLHGISHPTSDQLKSSDPHEVGMTPSRSDHYGPKTTTSTRHFHNEHHQLLQIQQHQQKQQQQQQQQQQHHQYRRPRPHPGHGLTLMIPSAATGRVVLSPAASSPATPGSLPVSPSAITSARQHSPAHALHSPTHQYRPHHHQHTHAMQSVQLQQPPLSPMAHSPVQCADDGSLEAQSMAQLLQQELEIKHDLEMFEQQGFRKQQQLALVNMQKMKLQQQQQQQHLHHQHQGRFRFHRRPSLQLGLGNLGGMPSIAQLATSTRSLPPVHDEEMVVMEV
ncbi:hypothetical protein EDD11_002114 [Mortierella claussenii]|nr:hypothetical protein EDD11_002114 [Mortierella claussenii]